MNFIIISTLMFVMSNAIPHNLLAKPSHSEASHDRRSRKQTIVLNAGKHLSEAITAKIVGPIVIFNSKVAAAAGALPALMAAQGAVIGSAIATPIEVGAVVGSSIASGVTGKLVAIPISLATGAVAKVVGVVETGKEVLDDNAILIKEGAFKLGHIILKPIAVIVGAQTALTGAGLGIAGSGIKGIGVGMESIGAKMTATGLKAKKVGALMIGWAFEPIIKAKTIGIKAMGAKAVGPKVVGQRVMNELEAKEISVLLQSLSPNDWIRSKNVGSKIHLPLLERFVKHDAESH